MLGGTFMAIINLNLSHEEFILFNNFAKMKKTTIEELLKKTLFEKIEDEYDFNLGEEAYNKYVKSGKKATPIKDFWRELDNE